MARKTHEDALGVVGAETLIGTGVVVHGELTSDADIVIDGSLEGDIKTSGDVTIGINAHIKGSITSSNASIAGSVTGNVTASGEVTIRETGHLKGDISSSGLAIASGGVFIGNSIMNEPPRIDHTQEPIMKSPDDKLAK